jgi:hypothetical protein
MSDVYIRKDIIELQNVENVSIFLKKIITISIKNKPEAFEEKFYKIFWQRNEMIRNSVID